MEQNKKTKSFKNQVLTVLAMTTLFSYPATVSAATEAPHSLGNMRYQAIPDPHTGSNNQKLQNPNPHLPKDDSTTHVVGANNHWTPVSNNTGTTSTSGRVSSITVTNSSRGSSIYVGTANGGMWSSPDGKNWKAMTDDEPSLATGSVTVDPHNPDVLYVGTGEEHFSADSRYGRGILKSTNSGKTWSVLGADVLIGAHIGKIAVDPFDSSTLWVAANTGLWQSTDGGQSWNLMFQGDTDGMASPFGHIVRPTDIYLDHHTPGVIYMSAQNGGLYKSTDDGQNFSYMGGVTELPNWINDNLPLHNFFMSNVSFSVVEVKTTAQNTIYASYSDVKGELMGVFVSKDDGNTWTKLDNVPQYFDLNYSFTGVYNSNDAIGQGDYDNVIAVDPANPNHILAGGVTLIESRDEGKSWTVLDTFSDKSHPSIANIQPSQHVITFDSKGNAFIGNDGGIFEETAKGEWLNLNSNLNTQMFNPGLSAIDKGSNILVGTQGNGTFQLNHNQWNQVYGGTGGFTYMDPLDPNVMYVESQYGDIEHKTDPLKDTSWSPSYPGYVNQFGWNTAPYLTPFTVRPLNGKQVGSYEVIVGAECVERSRDNGITYDAISPNFTLNGWLPDPVVAFSQSQSDPNVVYAGSSYGQLYVSFNANSDNPAWTNITPSLGDGDWLNGNYPDPVSRVYAIAINPKNPKEITVTYGNEGATAPWTSAHVFTTFDASASSPTWMNVSENLPSGFILSAAYLNDKLVVGSEQGVYISKPGTMDWSKLGSDLPNAPVTSLVDAGNGTLIAGTYGRGAFKLHLDTDEQHTSK